METSRGFVLERREEAADAGPGPALPSRRDVVLIVLFFLFVTFGFRNVVIRLLPGTFTRNLSSWFSESSRMVALFLYLIKYQAALLATVLLYFPVVRRDPPSVGRERRGEIFSGMVNLHILVLAVALSVATQIWPEFDPLYVGTMVLGSVVSTAFWCVVGFHLCEGRYLVPLGGIVISSLLVPLGGMFIKALLLEGVSPGMYAVAVALSGGIVILAPLLGLIWELWALIRAGSGFELFPTGILPAIRKCARVFLLSAATFWFLGESPWLLTAGFEHFSLFYVLRSPAGYDVEMLIAYLVPLFLLGWPAGEMARRSRKLTLVLLGFVALATLLCVLPFHLLPYSLLRRFFVPPRGIYTVVSRLIFPFWTVFVPLSMYRWWVRGYFMRPLVVVVSGICLAGILAAFFPLERGMVSFTYTFGRLLVIVLAVPLLFLRIPPPEEESWGEQPGGDSPASLAQD